MVNLAVDGYTKTQINRKYSEKRKKTTTCWKPIKRIL